MIQAAENNTNLLRGGFDDFGVRGIYSPEMDLAIVRRFRQIEQMSGSIYTEGILVHELVHASSMFQQIIEVDIAEQTKDIYTPRVGFCLTQQEPAYGLFLEEGFCDMVTADYIAKNISTEERAKLASAYKGTPLPMEHILLASIDELVLPIPLKYFYIGQSGALVVSPSCYAGYAVELLVKMESSLMPIMIKARTSKEGLQELARALNKIKPGLYAKLQNIGLRERDFYRGLHFILDEVIGTQSAN